jgi:hypothetical protein
MNSEANLEIEKRLSYINARLADTAELLQTSISTTQYSRKIICALENEVEEIYLSLSNPPEANKEDIIGETAEENA